MSVDSQPYPWPYDGDLDPHRLALVIAGAQPAWARRSVGADTVAAVIGKVAAAVRDRGAVVVHVRHTGFGRSPSGLPPTAASGADGAEEWGLCDDPAVGDVVVDAAGVDGFCGSALDFELRRRGIDTLVLCGYGAEAAVSSMLRSANDRGYECLTLTDASAPFDEVLGAHDLSSITMSGGIFGAIASSESFLEALP